MKSNKINGYPALQPRMINELFPGKAYMIRAIKDLYPIFKYEPQLFDLDENLLINNDAEAFFYQMITAIEKIERKTSNFSIADENGRYVVNKRCFHDFRSDTLYYVAISFLPELEKINKDLHNLFCMCLTILTDKGVAFIKAPCFDEEWELEWITDMIDDTDDGKLLAKEVEDYHKYSNYYECLISKISREGKLMEKIKESLFHDDTPDKVKDMISDLLPTLQAIDNSYINLDELCDRAREEFALEHEMEEEDVYQDGSPVEMMQLFRIMWFDSTLVLNNITANLGEYSGNFGEIYPSLRRTCNTSEEYMGLQDEFKKTYGTFPEDLAKALESLNFISDEIIKYIKRCKAKRRNSRQLTYSMFTQEQITVPESI